MSSENDPLRGDETAALIPAVDVFEDASGITLFADLPGVPKEALTIDVDGDTLTLAGEVRLQAPDVMRATHVEVEAPRYRRQFTLSKELDPGKVVAELRHGVLKLRIPKVQQAQARKIEIRVD